MVGPTPVTQLAQRIGSTPFYAYSRALLRARVRQLRTALPRWQGACYWQHGAWL